MELLFNYDTNDGDLEIHQLIGHIDKDIEFNLLKSDIIAATNELIKIIGKPLYDSVLATYKTEPTEGSSEAELVYYVRYPIALDAYRHHAKSSDVVHSNNGRKMRVDEHNKMPFEWALDRDNENLERKYYKAIDHMIDYLDASSTLWKSSAAYQKTQKYFVRTTSDFDSYFPINSRLLLIKLQPGIHRCETKEIISRIGLETYDVIKTKQKNNTPLTADESGLVELIKEACVFASLSWAMRVLRVTLFPEGVLQRFVTERNTTQGKMPAIKMETELAAQEFNKRALEVLQDIENSVKSSTEPITKELFDKVTSPNFGFDDCDKFVN